MVNVADTKQKLDNDVFQAASIAQKYNCMLTRLDYLQEEGFMSSIPLGRKPNPNPKRAYHIKHRYLRSLYHTGAFSEGRSPVLRLKCAVKQHDTLRPQATEKPKRAYSWNTGKR